MRLTDDAADLALEDGVKAEASHADVSDEELAAFALAADPDPEIAADAVSVWSVAGPEAGRAPGDGLLPEWYMPSMTGRRVVRGWRRRVVLLIIAAFLTIDAYGLCSTYGWVSFG